MRVPQTLIASLTLLCTVAISSYAQVTKIPYPLPIKKFTPNTVVRSKFVMETESQVEQFYAKDPLPARSEIMRYTVLTKFTSTMTQKLGTRDKQGNIKAEVTLNQVKVEAVVDDELRSADDSKEEEKLLDGKKLIVIYDRKGATKSVQAVGDWGKNGNKVKKSIEGMLTRKASGTAPAPKMLVAFGEARTRHWIETLPMPMNIPGVSSLKVRGTEKISLRLLEDNSTSPLAIFESTQNANEKLVIPGVKNRGKVLVEYNVQGSSSEKFDIQNFAKNFMEVKMNMDIRVVRTDKAKNQPRTFTLKTNTRIKTEDDINAVAELR